MLIDITTAAILLALIAMGVAWGTLRERVSKTSKDVDLNRKENREEHKSIFDKLEEIKSEIRNGHKG